MPNLIDRMNIHVTVSHQQHGENPTSVQIVLSRPLTIQEQPYNRKQDITATAVPLPLGHFAPDQVGYVLIENRTKLALSVNPTEDQKKDLAKRILRVISDGAAKGFLLAPGDVCLFSPEDASQVKLVSLSGTATANVNVYPR